MNNVFYAVVLIVGAATLVVEAYRNYSQSARETPFPNYKILENVKAKNLCSPREWNMGGVMYTALYLVAYVLILSMAELFELIRNSEIATDLVGATDSGEGGARNPLGLLNSSYAKPIFVSAFIISFFSLSSARNVELHVRSLAHKIAGVPRSVYQVLDRLQSPAFLPTVIPPTGPLLDSFRTRLTTLSNQTSAASVPPHNYEEILQAPLCLTTDEGRADYEGNSQYLLDISRSLRMIDFLQPLISLGRRARHFPHLGNDDLNAISRKLEDDITTLRDEIGKFKKYDVETLEYLKELSGAIANSARAVFSVHFICNNRTILNIDPNGPTSKAQTFIERGYRADRNAFAFALGAGMIASFVGLGVLHALTLHHEFSEIRPKRMVLEIHSYLNQQDRATYDYEECEKHPAGTPLNGETVVCAEGAKAYIAYACLAARGIAQKEKNKTDVRENGGEMTPLETHRNAALNSLAPNRQWSECSEAIDAAARNAVLGQIPRIFNHAFWDTFKLAFLISAVVLMTMFERETRLEEGSWQEWDSRQVPYIRFVSASLLPAAGGVFALSLAYLIKLFFDTRFAVTTSQIEFLFLTHWKYFLAFLFPSFLLAISCFVALDMNLGKKKKFRYLTALLVAIAFSTVTAIAVLLIHVAQFDFLSDVKKYGYLVPLQSVAKDALLLLLFAPLFCKGLRISTYPAPTHEPRTQSSKANEGGRT